MQVPAGLIFCYLLMQLHHISVRHQKSVAYVSKNFTFVAIVYEEDTTPEKHGNTHLIYIFISLFII